MLHKYVWALKGVLMFCWVTNYLHNVIAMSLNISCYWDEKKLKCKERIKEKFMVNRMN